MAELATRAEALRILEVDLFLEFATPPGSGRDAAAAFADGIALARAADAAGFGAVWAAEHHFLGDYSASAAPDMLLAAIARETTQIKLGFAVLPLPIHDPARVAERLATLDAISGGRMMWGVGRGITADELAGFGIRPEDTRRLFRERLAELRAALATGRTERHGRTYELSPRLARNPGPGWIAAVSPETFPLAAELGLDVLAGPFKPWPLVKSDLARYRRLRPEGRTSFTLAAFCHQDGARARSLAEGGIVWAYRRIMEVAQAFLSRRTEGYEHYRTLGFAAPIIDKVLSVTALEAMGLAAVGTPAHVLGRLGSLRDSGLDRVSLTIGGGDVPREEAVRAIELIGREVLPALKTPAAVEAARA